MKRKCITEIMKLSAAYIKTNAADCCWNGVRTAVFRYGSAGSADYNDECMLGMRDMTMAIAGHAEWTIRPLNEQETDLLNEFLYLAIFVPEGVEQPEQSIVELPELQIYIKEFGRQKGDFCLLAEHGHSVVGAVWVRLMHDYGYIDDRTPSLAVSLRPAYRNQGIGTALLTAMMRKLKADGVHSVSLSVQKANRAVNLYRRLGFVTVRETDEEFIMKAEL